MTIIRIAIDGPGGAGKSTIAKALANAMAIDYIDTGSMYRAVGYKIAKNNVSLDDLDSLAKLLADTKVDISGGNTILDGQIVNQEIRTPEMSSMASQCSAIPIVREKLVALQREMGKQKSIVMDGRDIGTNVLKDAECKIYMNADIEVRADRRYKELIAKGQQVTYQQVLSDIETRDYNDMNRKLNPLKKADDAVEIDTTNMTIDEVVNRILEEVQSLGNS